MSHTAPTAPVLPAPACAVSNLIPYAHVASVDASLAFYARLGFTPQRVMRENGSPTAPAFWALTQAGGRGSGDLATGAGGHLMLARASGPIDASQQAVLFYLYSADVAALRRHLLSGGLRDAGTYLGVASPFDGPCSVFEVSHPHHMPDGELRVTDPDGYVILIGQLG